MTMDQTIDETIDPHDYIALQDSMDESVSDQLLTAREREVRTRVRDVVAHHVAPMAARHDEDHSFAGSSYQALAAAGLAGLIFPVEIGGSGDSTVAYAAAVEEIAAACPSTSLIYMTQMHAAYPILHYGSAELQRQYIPGLLDGSLYGSLAITEPSAGSDAASLRTRARRSDSGSYRIEGSKIFITTGDRADVLVCFASTQPEAGRRGISAFVVDGDVTGLTRGAPMRKMGMHGSSTAEVFFSDVEVPEGRLLGAEGDAWTLLTSSVVKSRISAASQGVGIARAVLARTHSFLDALFPSRLPVPVAEALAVLRAELLQARLLLYATARAVDTESGASVAQIAMMKLRCTDVGWTTARESMRLLGSFGDLRQVGVERYLRDAKVTQIYDGTNEIQKLLISRDRPFASGGPGRGIE